MQAILYNQNAKNIGKVEIPNGIFGLPANDDLVFQVANSQLANKRQVIAHAKGRSEVRGGGKKPWRQKGTGRARHGSIRSPIWKGGGVTFGPTKERIFKKKINKKMARKAMLTVLSSKVRDGQLVVVDSIHAENGKTKEIAPALKNLGGVFKKRGSTLVVTPVSDKNLFRATRNLPDTDVVESRNLNVLELLSRKNVVLAKDAVDVIVSTFNK